MILTFILTLILTYIISVVFAIAITLYLQNEINIREMIHDWPIVFIPIANTIAVFIGLIVLCINIIYVLVSVIRLDRLWRYIIQLKNK